MEKDNIVQISVNLGNKIFFYKGIIISEDEHLIVFNDFKIGEIKIGKNTIQLIKPVSIKKTSEEGGY